MGDYITLHGAEDVRSAGHTMARAAEEMKQAAMNMDGAFERHQRFLDDWLDRFSAALNVARCPKCRADPALSPHECPLRGRTCTCCTSCSTMCRTEADQS